MLLKLCFLSCLAVLATADNSIDAAPEAFKIPTETRVESSVSFETSHKRPDALEDDDNAFQTSHKIPQYDDDSDLKSLQGAMNLLPSKERPELNPVLSALINEDVMKSIEAKRAIEQEELEFIKAEADAAAELKTDDKLVTPEEVDAGLTTEAPVATLTTAAPVKKVDLDDDEINVGFVDQTINLDTAGSENNKKSRIEIKKGPNGQDYEYEYVYYYEEDEDDSKAKPAENVAKVEDTRGKSRYTNIERSTTATPVDNTLVSGKAKGRSSSVSSAVDDIEPERLPAATRFPSRGKNVDAKPTPASDSLENAAEKKKISVKRPSLELVDSETFNTDEKQAKGTRNGDTEQEEQAAKQAAAVAAAAIAAAKSEDKADASKTSNDEANDDATERSDADVEQTTPSMEKAALDLYAILTNENFNMDMTTDVNGDATTLLPDTTNPDDEGLTTLMEAESSSTTTTTTTPAPTTTTTTTTTTVAPLFGGGRRGGLPASGRNRFKLNKPGASSSGTTTTSTEAPAASEPTKANRNRFSRPSIGGRNRVPTKTTSAPAPAAEEEEVAVKEVKPVTSAFGRSRPRNRFNLRGSSTTEKPAEGSEEAAPEEAASVSSTTSRSLRARPTLNLRGRSRPTTTTKAPASNEDAAAAPAAESEGTAEDKPATPAPGRPSRFNLNRPGGNRLLPRGKLGRTTEAPPSASSDSDADSSHHNDVKGGEADGDDEAKAAPAASHVAGGLNRLKTRPRLNSINKTEGVKPKPATAAVSPVAPRKINPLLAKRRLQLGPSTTEAAPIEEESAAISEEPETKDETVAAAEDSDSAKDDTTEESETTTKTQARGLGLLGQRRRLPLRKPGTIL